jgi:hypothetical protein
MAHLPHPLRDDSVARESWATLACLGIVAAVLADLVHEIAGHMLVGLLAGDHMTRLSSVGLQTKGPVDRLLSAAGTITNVLAGAATLGFMKHRRGSSTSTWAYFLLLFAAFNLFNSGYLVWSGIAVEGDWAVVIAKVSPPWLGRAVLIVAGVALYWLSTAWIGWQLERRFGTAGITRGQWYKLLLVPYLTAAAVMITASIFNPYGGVLILISGFGASAMLNYGLIAAGGHVPVNPRQRGDLARSRPVNVLWLLTALLVGSLFIAVLGPGIPLEHATH